MICNRCGYCCSYFTVIIRPGSVREDLDFEELDEYDFLGLDGSERCPHLFIVDGKAHCAVHHYDWFPNTPCGQYAQIGEEDEVCRTGAYMKEHPELLHKYQENLMA